MLPQKSRLFARKIRARGPTLLADLRPTTGVQIKEIVGASSIAEGTVTRICTVARGTGQDERNGNAVVVRTIAMNSVYQNPATTWNATNLASSLCRQLVFVDKNMDGSTPAVADVLQVTTNSVTLFNSPVTSVNKDRFVFLSDQYVKMEQQVFKNAVPVDVVVGDINYVKLYKKMNTQQTYSSDLANSGMNGNIYMLWLMLGNDLTNTSGVTCNVVTKLRFTDPQ